MAEITLKAATGRGIGTGPSKRLRVEGMVPGVVYGLGADPVAVTTCCWTSRSTARRRCAS